MGRLLGRLALITINDYPLHISQRKWEAAPLICDTTAGATVARPCHGGYLFRKLAQLNRKPRHGTLLSVRSMAFIIRQDIRPAYRIAQACRFVTTTYSCPFSTTTTFSRNFGLKPYSGTIFYDWFATLRDYRR